MPVRLLNNETIGKIAAGEVIERPVSVVKELMENAIDAGANRVAVAIRGGGRDLIEVSDDGSGMRPHEAELSLQRHATSKITSFEDLDRLTTLGFRGEALPSIAAVSDLRIRTRPSEASAGTEISAAFGVAQATRSAVVAPGTVVTVRDLFGNVPARLKFLRQPSTEAAYIGRAVAAYAAANPNVAVSLHIDDRRTILTDGQGDAAAAAVGAFGQDVRSSIIPLHPLDDAAAVPGIGVDGWIAAPTISRSHRQGMVFFVNGRWVQNRALAFALEDAYHSLLMVGRHPVALVRIQVDPAEVDVNVHPTKAEVKFVDERAVYRAVQRAVHAALGTAHRNDLPSMFLRPIDLTSPQASATLPIPQPAAWGRGPGDTTPVTGLVSPGQVHVSGLPLLRVLGQVAGTYIIAEGSEGMYLIDQHAAHERVLYEKILDKLARQTVDRQPLLDPLVIELSPDDLAILERSADELHQIGFEVEAFSPNSVAIRTVPAIRRGIDIAERFRLILQELRDGGVGDSWLDAVAISTACHTSIRAGQTLSLAEMRELIADLERSSQPRACGHGRPTMLHVTADDLARQFSRR